MNLLILVTVYIGETGFINIQTRRWMNLKHCWKQIENLSSGL